MTLRCFVVASLLLAMTAYGSTVAAYAEDTPASKAVTWVQWAKTNVVARARTAGGWVSAQWQKLNVWMDPYLRPAKKAVSKQFSTASREAAKAWDKFGETEAGQAVQRSVTKATVAAKKVVDKAQIVPKAENQAVIYLKNGSALSCAIVSENEKEVVASWEGGEVAFSRGEISRIERNRAIHENDGIFIPEAQDIVSIWPHKNNPIIRLRNHQIVDGVVKEVRPDIIIVSEALDGGGAIDHEIERGRIETLEFKPVKNPETDRIEAGLRTQFPKMSVYKEGMVTLVTDSRGSSLKTLKQMTGAQMTALYLEFPELLRGREPSHQHFVVVFDDLMDYYQYAITDGVPPWMCPGYFSPTDKVLFMMNYIGDQFTGFLYGAVTGVRDAMNQDAEAMKDRTGGRFEAQIDGAVQDFKTKWENAMAFLKSIFADMTLVTLRHEITHEFFHNWGLQTIVVSKTKALDPEIVKKKKELLETKDLEKKKELITELIGMRKKEDEKIEIDAANSWFVEGVAEYASTSALGLPNAHRQYVVKDVRKKNELLPVEQLTVYKMGSFAGVTDEAALSAYAQSWSLVDYLMTRHRSGFIAYLKRMAEEKPQESQDDLKWLLEAVGLRLRVLEEEWHAHIDSYPETPNPEIEEWFRVREILGIK